MVWVWSPGATEFDWSSPVTVFAKKVGIGGQSSSVLMKIELSNPGSGAFTEETYPAFLGALAEFFEAQGFVSTGVDQETLAGRSLTEE